MIPSLRDPRIHVAFKGGPLLQAIMESQAAYSHPQDQHDVEDKVLLDIVQKWWNWLPRPKQVFQL